MMKLRHEIDDRLKRIDFNDLWPGFKRYEYALYDDEDVFLRDRTIKRDKRFMGNTSIHFEGEHIAIWYIGEDGTKNLDLLSASLIHEMFHAHQFSLSEKRFFSDLKGLNYPYEIENLKLKYLELKALRNAHAAESVAEKKVGFGHFMYLRNKRASLIESQIDYEKAIETIEGVAEYMTLKSLKLLSDMEYEKRLAYACEWISGMDTKLLDTRRLAYFTGALICHLADGLGLDFKSAIGFEERYIVDILEVEYTKAPDETLSMTEEIQLKIVLDQYLKENERQVNEVITNDEYKLIEGEYTICGYDPMNMHRVENMVYHKSFLGIDDGENKEFIMGPVVTESEDGDFSLVSRYYRRKS